MFDAKEYVSDIEECIIATGRPRARDDMHRPEFYYALLKSSVLKLPDEWESSAQSLILELKNPTLSQLIDAIAADVRNSSGDLARSLCYDTLLRFAVLLSSNEHAMRSSGPM